MHAHDDTPAHATRDPAPSTGPSATGRNTADAAADASQRRLVQLSLLLCPGVEDEPGR
jgi:hypothetical protein